MSLLIPSILKQGEGGGSPPPTGIAYEGTGTLFAQTGAEQTTGSITVDMPSGLTNGDLLVAVVAYKYVTDPTLPAGWTERTSSSADNSPYGFGLSIFTHPVTDAGSEPGSIDVDDLYTDAPVTAVIIRLSNAASWDAIAESVETAAGVTSHDTPDVTPTASSGLILQVATFQPGVNVTLTCPATEIVNRHANFVAYVPLGISYTTSTGTASQGGAIFTTSTGIRNALATLAFH